MDRNLIWCEVKRAFHEVSKSRKEKIILIRNLLSFLVFFENENKTEILDMLTAQIILCLANISVLTLAVD